MRVLFNFKFWNALYLTDKYSVIRRRPFTEINSRKYSFSPFNIRPLRLWSPGLLCSYAYGLLALSAPSLSAPDQPPKPLGNSQTDAEIIINANVTISHTPLALSIPGINPPWFHWFPSSVSSCWEPTQSSPRIFGAPAPTCPANAPSSSSAAPSGASSAAYGFPAAIAAIAAPTASVAFSDAAVLPYSGYPINSDPSASLSACPHLLLWCFWCVRWACRTQAQSWK